MSSSARAVALTVLFLGACRDAPTPLQPRPGQSQDLTGQLANGQIVPGQYIVVFKDGVADPEGLAQTLVSLYGGSLKHTYKSAIKGFAAILSDPAGAAIVGSATYGVAKGVFLHGVRVYAACNTDQTAVPATVTVTSDVVAGVDWVTAHHLSPAVANLSVSLSPSRALTTAVHNLQNSGVFVTATAANHNADACLEAGGARGAFTPPAGTQTPPPAAISD